MFCENCGAPVDDNAVVCTSCGAPVKKNGNSVNLNKGGQSSAQSANMGAGQNMNAGQNMGGSIPNSNQPPASVPKKFCKNCGNQMDMNAAVCTRCGFAWGNGSNYCPTCGAHTQVGQAVCVQCGSALSNQGAAAVNPNAKSKVAAGLLGIFLGSFGIHNFYLGYTKKAVIQLLISVLSCGTLAVVSEIWGLIEGIFYLMGKDGYKTDANGNALKD